VEETDLHIEAVIKCLKSPVVGSDDWYLQEIVDSYFNKKSELDNFGPYSKKIFYCSAEADYELLGQHTDTIDCKDYSDYIGNDLPVKLNYTPHWYRTSSNLLNLESFKVYQWLKNCKHQGISIARNSELWLQVETVEELELESYKLLKLFRKPKGKTTYRPVIQDQLDYLESQQEEHGILPDIISIELVGHSVDGLNKRIADKRKIPLFKVEGEVQFPKEYLQWYLKHRICEWQALGGEILFDKGYQLAIYWGKASFQRPFYWDLWKDIKNLRSEYRELLALTLYIQNLWREHKGIQFETKERAYSFDTQT
jgi:hypothetical protein